MSDPCILISSAKAVNDPAGGGASVPRPHRPKIGGPCLETLSMVARGLEHLIFGSIV
jgi:hypothetical protein